MTDEKPKSKGGRPKGSRSKPLGQRVRGKILQALNKLTPDELLKMMKKNPSTMARLAQHLTKAADKDGEGGGGGLIELHFTFDGPAGEPLSAEEIAKREAEQERKRGPWKRGRPVPLKDGVEIIEDRPQLPAPLTDEQLLERAAEIERKRKVEEAEQDRLYEERRLRRIMKDDDAWTPC
jgi:hypothetical protein